MTVRLKRLALALVLIVLGLASRKVAFLPAFLGDGLWAGTVFLAWGMLLVRLEGRWLALLAILTSWAVEFSQLLTWDWLQQVRSTTMGHLLLGQGFLASDLVAYLIGIACIYLADKYYIAKTPE